LKVEYQEKKPPLVITNVVTQAWKKIYSWRKSLWLIFINAS